MSLPSKLEPIKRAGVAAVGPVTSLDRLVRLAARHLGVAAAGIVRCEPEGERLLAAHGLDPGLPFGPSSFARRCAANRCPLIVPDALRDPEFRAHPWVVDAPHLRFYVAHPLPLPPGEPPAVLFGLDPRPRPVTADELYELSDLAALAAGELERVDEQAEMARLAMAARSLSEPDELARLASRPSAVADLAAAMADLARQASAREESLKRLNIETISRLVIAAEYKDRATGRHIRRMAQYTELLARAAGLPAGEVELIKLASPMHDVGKIGLPDQILTKTGSLERDEWWIVQRHCVIGAGILGGSDSPLLQAGEIIALSHHERWDGTGYPNGLGGEDIPLYGRICAVADVFDALTSERSYKPKFDNDHALSIMREGRETHFDPAVLDLFLDHFDGILALQERGT